MPSSPICILCAFSMSDRSCECLYSDLMWSISCWGKSMVVIKLAGGLLFFLPFPYLVTVFSLLYTTLLYLVAVFSLLFITLHYWGHCSLLYSTCVRFMVAGGDLFVTPHLWHPASVAVRTLS